MINGDFEKPITENDEKLCDYFAKCLLAPQCLIILRKEFDINTIVTKYKVSKMVAENWLNAINNRIATFGEDCLTDTEKSYIKQIKNTIITSRQATDYSIQCGNDIPISYY